MGMVKVGPHTKRNSLQLKKTHAQFCVPKRKRVRLYTKMSFQCSHRGLIVSTPLAFWNHVKWIKYCSDPWFWVMDTLASRKFWIATFITTITSTPRVERLNGQARANFTFTLIILTPRRFWRRTEIKVNNQTGCCYFQHFNLGLMSCSWKFLACFM